MNKQANNKPFDGLMPKYPITTSLTPFYSKSYKFKLFNSFPSSFTFKTIHDSSSLSIDDSIDSSRNNDLSIAVKKFLKNSVERFL